MNADINAKPADITKHLPDDDYVLVRSSFLTIQGEGPFAGRPAYFIRLGGCNLGSKTKACSGCDTSFEIHNSKPVLIQDLVNQAYSTFERMRNLTCDPVVVITGGEPSLHKNLPKLVRSLCKQFSTYEDLAVQIESNGYSIEVLVASWEAGAYVVLSPKASNKGYAPSLDLKAVSEKALACFLQGKIFWREKFLEFLSYKFVLSADPTNQHHEVPLWVKTLDLDYTGRRPTVYVSPAAVYKKAYTGEVSSAWDDDLIDREATAANYAYAGQYALKYGLMLSIQQHLFVSMA